MTDDLKALSDAATQFDLTTAEIDETGLFECPCCQGDGEVEAHLYMNMDGVAANVMFSGIGNEFVANERFIAALVNAYRAGRLGPVPVWQDMSSAPKDGTWIIVRNGESISPAAWEDDSDEWGSGEVGWCYGNTHYGGTLYEGINLMKPQPTHWQPLPTPPASEAGDEN